MAECGEGPRFEWSELHDLEPPGGARLTFTEQLHTFGFLGTNGRALESTVKRTGK